MIVGLLRASVLMDLGMNVTKYNLDKKLRIPFRLTSKALSYQLHSLFVRGKCWTTFFSGLFELTFSKPMIGQFWYHISW